MRYYQRDKYKKRVADTEPVAVENRVRFYRRLKELTQDELGEMIGTHASVIYKIENRLVAPKITTVFKLSKALGVEPLHLFFEPGENPPMNMNPFAE